jgi:bacterioferritin
MTVNACVPRVHAMSDVVRQTLHYRQVLWGPSCASTNMTEPTATNTDGPFLLDIKEIRKRAREHIEQGAVTPEYKSNRTEVVRILNEALATEIVCVLRYKRHQYMAAGINAIPVAAEFAQHAAEEQGHADMIAARITQLDGEPNFNPEGLLTRAHSEYKEGKTLVDMIQEDLIAERIAIDTYSEIIRYLGNNDSTSRLMMEKILSMEEEHAEDMKTLLAKVDKDGHVRNARN